MEAARGKAAKTVMEPGPAAGLLGLRSFISQEVGAIAGVPGGVVGCADANRTNLAWLNFT
jgi:hypothetical protein